MSEFLLFAAVVSNPLVLGGGLVAGLAVGFAAHWVWIVVHSPRLDHLLQSEIERDRRRLLRLRSGTYRRFEPIVDALAGVFRTSKAAEALRRDLVLVEPPPPRDPVERWLPEECLAVKQIEAAIVGLLTALLVGVVLGPFLGIVFGTGLALAGPRLLAGSVRTRAELYRAEVRARMPMVIDLIGLMLEANATLIHAVESVARENSGHPVGELFGVLAESIRRSVPQDEALRRMADMIDDQDVNELVFTLTATGQTSGLRDILRSMAAPMRTRRVQQLEQASERAKVSITFPGMIIMVGCLFIVLALFVLPAGKP